MNFNLEIITPKGIFLNDTVEELYIETVNGYRGIMANHDTLITEVKISAGFIKAHGIKTYYAFHGGVLNVSRGKTILVINDIESSDTIDIERAEASKLRAEERLSHSNLIDITRAKKSLQRAIARIKTKNKNIL